MIYNKNKIMPICYIFFLFSIINIYVCNLNSYYFLDLLIFLIIIVFFLISFDNNLKYLSFSFLDTLKTKRLTLLKNESCRASLHQCCIIMHSFGGGGEKMALLLADQLVKYGQDVVIVCLYYLPELKSNLPQGVRLFMPKKAGKLGMLLHLLIIRNVVRTSVSVVGSLELQSFFVAALFAPGRAVGWLHKDLNGYLKGHSYLYQRIYRFLFAWSASKCRKVVCVSDGILQSCKLFFPSLKRKFIRIYNPVDIESIRAASIECLPAVIKQFMKRFPIILGVGRLEPQKNFSLLLEAHALLLQSGVDVGLCIVGEGSEREILLRKAAELGTSSHVLLPGFLNPYPVMAQARMLAQSSRFEGFGLVLVEALTLGLPVVAVDCPSGPKEILENGRYGILTRSDAKDLAQGLEDCLRQDISEQEQHRLRQRAECFSLARLLPRWLDVLHDSSSV